MIIPREFHATIPDERRIQAERAGVALGAALKDQMGWTPLLLTASECVPEWKCQSNHSTSRSVHDEHYDDWHRSGKKRFSGAWDE
jgi:hypothetical protein